MKKYWLYLFTFITLIASPITTKDKNETRVTVFIHGSFSLRPHLSIRNIINMLFDTVEESVYYRTTEISRRDPFFHKNQAMMGLGLYPININKPTKKEAAPIVAHTYEQVAKFAGETPSDLYYAFGWSGLVSHKLRYIEAGILYKKLSELVQKLKKEGKNPKVRIISYSHGGTLSLQIGAIHVTKPPSEQFEVDELFLLGTPIQVETDYLINSPAFKKVYNIYSKSDRIQTLDFFSFKRFFSKRKFSNRRNFTLPDKLTQIKINITDYLPKKENSKIPFPRDYKELKKHFKKKRFDPGHFELWFMGWTILTYRQDFPFNPLPIVTLLPLIIKDIHKDPKLGNDLIVDIHPYKEQARIYNYGRIRKSTYFHEKAFMPKSFLEQLKTHALKYEPVDYNIETYNRKMYDAIDTARYEYNQIKKLKRTETRKDKFNKRKKIPTEKKLKVFRLHEQKHCRSK